MKNRSTSTQILTYLHIEEIINQVGVDVIMDTLIRKMEQRFLNFDPKKTIIPIRSGFNYTTPEVGLVEWMPLYEKEKQVTIKLVGYHPKNPEKYHLPTIISTISCYDTATGHLEAIVDGVSLTALRTGAASAVASRFFAHQDSSVLGLIGCGAQAVTQLHAISRVFNLKKILYYDLHEATQASFQKRTEVLQLTAEFQPASIQEIVEGSDILCTATSIEVGEGPLFGSIATQEHLHINAVGADFPEKTELPLDLLRNSFVCPDFLEQALKEGECQKLEKSEIGEDIFHCFNHPTEYAHLKKARTVFDSTGLPLEDLVAMEMFLEYGEKLGLGDWVSIEQKLEDAKNPYSFIKSPSSQKQIDLTKELLKTR